MMKRYAAIFLALVLLLSLTACGKKEITDGTYTIDVTLSGGSGRSKIESASVEIQDGKATATITWSSPFYDYMMVDDVRYEPVQESGNAVFVFPVVLNQEMPVSANTVAMSQPHLIDYTLFFDSSTMR